MVPSLPDHVAIGLVGEDRDLLASHQVGNRHQILLGRHAPGGILGGVEKNGLGLRIVSQEPFNRGHFGPETVGLLQRGQHRASTAAFDIGNVGRKERAEDQHTVTGVQESLAEELFEDLRSRSGHDVSGNRGNVELVGDELRGRLSEFGDPRRGAVVRLVVFDRDHAGRLGRGGAVERAVTDLEFDDILPCSLQLFGHRQHGERGFNGQGLGKLTESNGHVDVSLQWIHSSPGTTPRGHFVAIVCANGRRICSVTNASSNSSHWVRNATSVSSNEASASRLPYCRTVKYTLINSSGKSPFRTW